ncbi:MAG TPA: TetR/AcrR family transcriptional regulator [Porticoccaceae bacterium]
MSQTPPPKKAGTGTGRSRKQQTRRHYLPAEERRNQILESAREVFAHSGLKGARTRELAKAAGINPATLFDHFESKEDLFMAAIMQPLGEQLENARERVRAYETAESREALHALLSDGIQHNLESMVDTFPLLVQALFSDRQLGEQFYRERILPLFQTRADMQADLTREGFDGHLIQVAFFGMFFAIAMDRLITNDKRDLSDIARQISELVTGGCVQTQFAP